MARLYWESKLAFFAPKDVPIPAAVGVFPDELSAAPRSWTKRAYPKLIHYNQLPKGGHFAVWEQPSGVQIAALIGVEGGVHTDLIGRAIQACDCGEGHA